MKLAELQQLFQRFIFEEDFAIESYIAPPPVGAAKDRLLVYGDGYGGRLEEVLAKDFTLLLKLMGDDEFYPLAYRYIMQNPSEYFSIDKYGENFSTYLEQSDAFYAEIAKFEWTENSAFIAKDAKIMTREDMQKIPATNWPTLSFNLHPSLHLLWLSWNSLIIIDRLRTDRKPVKAKRLTKPLPVIIGRNDFDIYHYELTSTAAKLLTGIQLNKNFTELCELLCEDLPENQVAPYIVNQFLFFIEKKLMINTFN